MTTNFSDSRGPRNAVSGFLRWLADRLHVSAGAATIPEFDQRLASKVSRTKPDATLAEIIQRAWTVGQTIDLSDVGYGPPHWKAEGKLHETPFPYYFFLAGLVRSQNCKRIFEIGTHYGGSTYSMLRGGVSQSEMKIVTVDITDLNPNLHKIQAITKIIGDANGEAVLKSAVLALSDAPIDLLYVDAAHEFLPTITNLGLYILLLRPRFVVIDDIVLNEGMRSLWNTIRVTQGSRAVNCLDVIQDIRTPNVGFGLLRLQ